MLAEMPTIVDEKKTSDDEDEKFATAEALAMEALRLAEEAKRAAERLAEVRATLLYLQAKNKPSKPQSLTVDVAVTEESTPIEGDDTSSDALVTPRSVTSPTGSVVSPVSILKTSASKSEPKEVRYAPDTVDPIVSPSKKTNVLQPAPSAEETDLIVKFYDAVGIDKICGLEFDADDQQSPVSPASPATKRSVISHRLAMKADPFEAGSLRVLDSVDQSEQIVVDKKEVVTDVSCIAETAPVSSPVPVTAETVAPVTAVDPEAVTPIATKDEPLVPPVPVPENDDQIVTIVAEPEEQVVVANNTTEDKTVLEANVQVEGESESAVDAESSNARAKVDPPSSQGKKDSTSASASTNSPPVAEESVVESAIATPKEEPVTKVAKNLTPLDTTTTVESKVVNPVSPLKKQLLARKRAPLLAKPDPFGGEHDDMDFIPCGSHECVAPEENDGQEQLSSPSMLCGWGA